MAKNRDFNGIFPEAASQPTPQGLKRSYLKTFETAPVQWMIVYGAAKVVKLSDDAVWAEMSKDTKSIKTHIRLGAASFVSNLLAERRCSLEFISDSGWHHYHNMAQLFLQEAVAGTWKILKRMAASSSKPYVLVLG